MSCPSPDLCLHAKQSDGRMSKVATESDYPMQSLFFHFTITFVVVCVMEGECEVITGLNRTTER
ncbi:Uncharacterized protein DAT39_006102, partial [Clarias magur]